MERCGAYNTENSALGLVMYALDDPAERGDLMGVDVVLRPGCGVEGQQVRNISVGILVIKDSLQGLTGYQHSRVGFIG